MKTIKENYFNTAFILVFLMLLWPLYINNFELFILEILIIASLFILIGINNSISINSSSVFILIGIITVIIVDIIIIVIIVDIIIAVIIVDIIIAVIIVDIIIVDSVSDNNISKKKRVLCSIQIISLLSFAILSFTVIPIKDYIVIEYNNEEVVVLEKGEYFFNANMNARVTRYNPH